MFRFGGCTFGQFLIRFLSQVLRFGSAVHTGPISRQVFMQWIVTTEENSATLKLLYKLAPSHALSRRG